MVASRLLGGDYLGGEMTANPPNKPTTSIKENTCWYGPHFTRKTREKHPRLKELFPCKTSVTGAYTIETTAILGQRISFNGLISYIPKLSRWSLSMRIKTTALSWEAVFPKINKGREWTNDKQRMYKPRHNWAFYVPSWPALQYKDIDARSITKIASSLLPRLFLNLTIFIAIQNVDRATRKHPVTGAWVGQSIISCIGSIRPMAVRPN